jgi:hypothetical protein
VCLLQQTAAALEERARRLRVQGERTRPADHVLPR